jgi:hypothetical protein
MMYNQLVILVCLIALIGTSIFLGFKYGLERGIESTLKALSELKIIQITENGKGDLKIYSGSHFPED